MVNIYNKICIEEKCLIRASYNYFNIKTPLYCVSHKKDNMTTA